MMIPAIIIVTGLLILTYIFVRRYQILTYGYSPLDIFSKQKKPLTHLFHRETEKHQPEVTIEEIMPKSESIDPKNITKAEILIRKAGILLDKGDHHTAERYFIQATVLDPSSHEAHSKLALIYLKNERFSKAEMLYRKLIVSGYKEPSYLSNLALALFQQHKLEEAKSFYQKAIEADPTRAGRFFSLAHTLYELNEFDQAIDNFRKAIELEPKNLDYLLSLAQVYIERNMNHEAETLLHQILATYPENQAAKDLQKRLKKDNSK